MRPLFRSFPLLLLFILAVGLIAAACGGDDDGYGSSATNKPGVATATAPGNSSPAATTAATVKLVGVADTAKGKALTDAKGMTLYTFKPDGSAAGKSACNGSCATTWPPLTTAASAMPDAPEGATGTFGVISRDDGTKQITHDSAPLYRYAGDTKAGDTNGDGVGGVWFVALATTSTASASPAPANQAQSGASSGAGSASATSAPPQPAATTAAPPTQAPATVPPPTTPPNLTATTDPYGGGGYNY